MIFNVVNELKDNYIILDKMWWKYTLIFLFGAAIGVFIILLIIGKGVHDNVLQIVPKKQPIDDLKNALLAAALCVMNETDPTTVNFNYMSYDGSVLPPFSGCNFVNACMSYFVDYNEIKKHPFYSPMMEAKILATELYLQKNFDTDEKVQKFFKNYSDKYLSEKKNSVCDTNIKDDDKLLLPFQLEYDRYYSKNGIYLGKLVGRLAFYPDNPTEELDTAECFELKFENPETKEVKEMKVNSKSTFVEHKSVT